MRLAFIDPHGTEFFAWSGPPYDRNTEVGDRHALFFADAWALDAIEPQTPLVLRLYADDGACREIGVGRMRYGLGHTADSYVLDIEQRYEGEVTRFDGGPAHGRVYDDKYGSLRVNVPFDPESFPEVEVEWRTMETEDPPWHPPIAKAVYERAGGVLRFVRAEGIHWVAKEAA